MSELAKNNLLFVGLVVTFILIHLTQAYSEGTLPRKTLSVANLNVAAQIKGLSQKRPSCDSIPYVTKEKIAFSLDLHSKEILQIFNNPPLSKFERKIGPIVIDEDELSSRTGNSRRISYSWQSALSLYEVAKGDNSPKKWFDLYLQVQPLIYYEIDHLPVVEKQLNSSHVMLQYEMSQAISKCLRNQKDCVEPHWDEQKITAAGFGAELENLRKAKTPEERTNILGFWRLFSPAFVANRHARKINDKILELPLDPGPLRGYENEIGLLLAPYFESIDFKVQIRWANYRLEKNVPRIILNSNARESTCAEQGGEVIQIKNGTSLNGLAHEIGHLLGFFDHYKIVWNPETCSYEDSTIPEDLMSCTGKKLTDFEFELLKKYY